jgi:hypothetical protein
MHLKEMIRRPEQLRGETNSVSNVPRAGYLRAIEPFADLHELIEKVAA